MDIMEAMKKRHSVRKYTNDPIAEDKVAALNGMIDEICAESGLNVRLFTNEPEAFRGPMAHYGSFEGCANYIAIAAEKKRDEDVGYYGEKLVLYAAMLGLDTCWVALTYNKSKVKMELRDGEKLIIVISIGYARFKGVPHKNKPLEELCSCEGEMPDWFKNAMDAAMMAPTAINQQRFHFALKGDKVKAKALLGPCSKIDLGIVKYHFELGAGDHPFEWA